MPDMAWSGRRCAGCMTKFSNADITSNMQSKKHLILGNEWDPFDATRFFDLPAVFATSFRKPLDRALSQFRFECIEDRVELSNIFLSFEKSCVLCMNEAQLCPLDSLFPLCHVSCVPTRVARSK